MKCLHCLLPVQEEDTNHILPASLGFGDLACTPPGTVCKPCNNYYGREVESQALASFPFVHFRCINGVPTRKGKRPTLNVTLTGPEAVLTADLQEQILDFDDVCAPKHPTAVCRMLVKWALEFIASNGEYDLAVSNRFDAARQFARAPKSNSIWLLGLSIDGPALESNLAPRSADRPLSCRVGFVAVGSKLLFQVELAGVTLRVPLDEELDAVQLVTHGMRVCRCRVQAGVSATDGHQPQSWVMPVRS